MAVRSKRNTMKRRRNSHTNNRLHNPATVAIPTPETCEQCRIAHRRIRFSISLTEAQEVIAALGSDSPLAGYFQAHLTIALRRDSYEYD